MLGAKSTYFKLDTSANLPKCTCLFDRKVCSDKSSFRSLDVPASGPCKCRFCRTLQPWPSSCWHPLWPSWQLSSLPGLLLREPLLLSQRLWEPYWSEVDVLNEGNIESSKLIIVRMQKLALYMPSSRFSENSIKSSPSLEHTSREIFRSVTKHLKLSHLHIYPLAPCFGTSINMSGRGKGKTAGKKSVSRSSKAGLQVYLTT